MTVIILTGIYHSFSIMLKLLTFKPQFGFNWMSERIWRWVLLIENRFNKSKFHSFYLQYSSTWSFCGTDSCPNSCQCFFSSRPDWKRKKWQPLLTVKMVNHQLLNYSAFTLIFFLLNTYSSGTKSKVFVLGFEVLTAGLVTNKLFYTMK